VTDDDFKKLEYAMQRLEGNFSQLSKRIGTLEKTLNFLANAGSVLSLLLLLLVIYCGLPWWAAAVLVVFALVKGRQRNETKEKDVNRPIEAGNEQSSHAMGINELTLRDEYKGLLKIQIFRESAGEKVPDPLRPWPFWLEEQLEKRGMTIFDLDPFVQQLEARKAGREKEWLEAREAARRSRK
jgi:hypothetical protein